ncbi:hypothetical protein Pmani_002945 [Petrolisthes manimaculis]|uniref:Uncharacterized protein n=1 Tax=Petrolisthes manimaculis TaxID=1843537 RepID=A0AAE1QJG7_9EUCA|nr:hypothetical protein Pmani_002945 [Petrolisthes manimaculis]
MVRHYDSIPPQDTHFIFFSAFVWLVIQHASVKRQGKRITEGEEGAEEGVQGEQREGIDSGFACVCRFVSSHRSPCLLQDQT